MCAHRVHVALGTDSVASNDAVDMFAEMRLVREQQRLSFEDVFAMATIEGARALGLEESLGSLEAGKRADFAVVSVRDAGMDPLEDMVGHARPEDVKATFVGGREVVVDDADVRAELKAFVKTLG
jgi:5-methylthioadenosine/S-adenosylhomocysteine deaminase